MALRSTALRLALVLALAALAPRTAAAEGGLHISNEPAATLLLPYFEVALPKKPGARTKGVTTVFTVGNAAADAVLAHVVLWSALGVPVTFFDLYLTGYDIETIDLAEVIDGRFPITADAQDDPDDTISPGGDFSFDSSFPGCSSVMPGPAQLPPESVEHMRTALTGKPSPLFGDKCLGRDYGEKRPLARGYVTVDAVNQCSLLFPDAPGYFSAGGNGIASNDNLLFGDWLVVDRKKKTAYGDALVHLRADASDPVSDSPGDYTFYARYVDALAADNRQPLATTFAAQFVNARKDALLPGGTSFVVWRDTKVRQQPFTCGTDPNPFPLAQNQIVAFDEEENPEEPQLPPVPPLPPGQILPFPGAAQKVAIGDANLPVSFERGWIYLNLNTTVAGQSVPTDLAQAFVTVLKHTKRHATALRAVALTSAGAP